MIGLNGHHLFMRYLVIFLNLWGIRDDHRTTAVPIQFSRGWNQREAEQLKKTAGTVSLENPFNQLVTSDTTP